MVTSLRVLWETGVRVSEGIALKLDNVGRRGLRVIGKGNAERVVFVQDGMVSAILLCAQELGLERDDYLFPSIQPASTCVSRART